MMGNHGYIVDFLREVAKINKNRGDVADPIVATKYAACHNDKDGKIEQWQGVPKAGEMCHTSPYMHKEEVRCISCAFGSCLGDCRSQFHKVSIMTF
jgi:hypothetical protein